MQPNTISAQSNAITTTFTVDSSWHVAHQALVLLVCMLQVMATATDGLSDTQINITDDTINDITMHLPYICNLKNVKFVDTTVYRAVAAWLKEGN